MGLKAEFLVPAELAKRWRLSINTLANWRCEKMGPTYVKMGHFVVYPIAEIRRYEREHSKIQKASITRARSS